MRIWRDLDNSYRRFGLTVWGTGCELNIGRRMYRMRWAR